jgi:mono/diheme cytochrome c family protein
LNPKNAIEKDNLRMKKGIPRLCFLIVVPGVLFATIGCQTESHLTTQSGPQGKSSASDLFNRHCSTCHGKDGRARTFRGRLVRAQNLADAKWQTGVTDEQVADAIKQGPEAMPAFENKLSQAEIDALVAYVRSFKDE